MMYRIEYKGFLQTVVRLFETRERAIQWCRQVGKPELIRSIVMPPGVSVADVERAQEQTEDYDPYADECDLGCGCKWSSSDGGWLIYCAQHNAAPEMLAALKGLFEHCAMVHKHWGEGSNQREADGAIKAARAAIAEAEGRS